jgi:hypothetical protein
MKMACKMVKAQCYMKIKIFMMVIGQMILKMEMDLYDTPIAPLHTKDNSKIIKLKDLGEWIFKIMNFMKGTL